MDPPARLEHDERQRADDKEQDPRHRARQPVVAGETVLKRRHVDAYGDKIQAVVHARAVVGVRAEYLQSPDHRSDRVIEQNGRRHGHGDGEQAPEIARAVDLRRLVQVGRNIAERRQPHDHAASHAPKPRDDKGGQRGLGVREKGERLHAQFHQPRVEQSVHRGIREVRRKGVRPDKSRRDAGDQAGKITKDADDAHTRDRPLQKEG